MNRIKQPDYVDEFVQVTPGLLKRVYLQNTIRRQLLPPDVKVHTSVNGDVSATVITAKPPTAG